MVLQSRDKSVLDFIEQMGAATTSQITRVFFKGLKQGQRIAQRRLALMHKEKLLKRTRTNINIEYCYFTVCNQLQHRVLITEFYVRLIELGGTIREFQIQKKIEHVIPDAYIEYDYRGYRHFMFLEVERSNNQFNQEKYEKLLIKKFMPIFPKVVIITSKNLNLKDSKINYIALNLDMKNIISGLAL